MIDPSLHLFLSYALLSIGIAYVPPKPIFRLNAVVGILAYTVFGLLHLDRSRGSGMWKAFCAQTTFVIVLWANYVLFIIKAMPPPGLGFIKKLMWAVENIAFNPRGIGMPWQIRNIPPFNRKDPNYVPMRLAFIFQRVITGILFFAILKAFGVIHTEIYLARLRDGDYDEEKESIIRRMRDVSMRELLIRAWLPIDYLVGSVCILKYQHSLVSAIAVALGDKPERWPPLLGDIRDAYSLRRFWGYTSLSASSSYSVSSNVCYIILVCSGTAWSASPSSPMHSSSWRPSCMSPKISLSTGS